MPLIQQNNTPTVQAHSVPKIEMTDIIVTVIGLKPPSLNGAAIYPASTLGPARVAGRLCPFEPIAFAGI